MLTSMGDVMREAAKRGWITTRDGNISIRRHSKFYITPSGVRKAIIHPEHIERGVYKDGDIIFDNNSDANPSGELEMHMLLQATHKGCRSVVHLHPTYTIAAMEKGWDLQYLASMFPEISRYTKVGPMTGIHNVCSKSLAISTYNCFTDHLADGKIRFDIVGQPRHGVTAMAKNPWDAFEHIERLEHICQIILASGVHPDGEE